MAILVLTALGVALAGWRSLYSHQCLVVRVSSYHWLVPHMGDGLVRLFWVRSSTDNLDVYPRAYNRLLTFATPQILGPADFQSPTSGTPRGAGPSLRMAGRGQVQSFGFGWQRPLVGPTPNAPTVQISFVRAPLWLPVVLLLVFPAVNLFRGPVRRRNRLKRNQCPECGYSREALPAPRCPECGRPHAEEDYTAMHASHG